jgi:hypothetical protein
MSHIDPLNIDPAEVAKNGPVKFSSKITAILYTCLYLGIGMLGVGLVAFPIKEVMGTVFTSLIYFMGMAAGGVVISIIFQIVHAKWAPPVRRIAEAGSSFLVYAWLTLMMLYFAKEYIWYWGSHPMPGREWWMQPDFTFMRNGLLLGLLFFLMKKYVGWSLRRDVGLMRELAGPNSVWGYDDYNSLLKGWEGSHVEAPRIEKKLIIMGPIMIALYALIYSLFSFEMIMGMDPIFFSTMFGAFIFVGNVYAAWAATALWMIVMKKQDANYDSMAGSQQQHDLGKLTQGFGILWAYLFFSQFLPIWYGNLPEETQWMILRTREMPWKGLGMATLGMCFIIPFLTLLSRDVKRTSKFYATVACIILVGLWCERYILVMPQLYPSVIPFGILQVGIFLGFFGAYALSVKSFLEKYPSVAVSDPAVEDSLAHSH